MSKLTCWGRGSVTCALMLLSSGLSTPASAAPAPAFRLQLRQARARFHKGKLNVRLTWLGKSRGGLISLRLLDLKGRSVATATQAVSAGQRGAVQLQLKVPPRHRRAPDLLRLAADFKATGRGPALPRQLVALSEIGDMPFVWLRGQSRLTAGSTAALRVTVRDLKKRPMTGARIALTLTANRQTLKARSVTDGRGGAQLSFHVPQRWAGRKAKLRLTARTAVFSRTVVQQIRIRRSIGALLLTDKPIYQPGQTVHLRLLVVKQPSRKPLARARVRFTALDPRGNRLFAQTVRTDAFGVAWTRVALSKHMAPGKLTLRARIQADAKHHRTTSLDVKVFRYRVPPFRLTIRADRGHYRPGMRLRATVQARYLQGKPVPGARVRVEARLLRRAKVCGSGRRYCRVYEQGTIRFATFKGRTDHRGRLVLRATIPRNILARILRAGGARVKLRASVTEPGGHTRHKTRTLPVSRHGVLLAARPEADKLVAGVSQRIFIIAAHPDGTAAPGRVQVDYWEVDDKLRRSVLRRLKVRTDSSGVAVVSVKPTGQLLRLSLRAKDRKGLSGYRTVTLRHGGARVLVQPQRALWRAGELLRVAIKTSGLSGRVYLDLKHRGQTVQTIAATLVHGTAFVPIRLRPDVDGVVTITARVGGLIQGWHSGWAPILVQPKRRLQLRIKAHRKQYRPGDPARLDLQVTDEQGRGQRVAVGLTVVDQGIYVLAGKHPGGEENHLLIEQDARAAKARLAGWTLQRLLHSPPSAKRHGLAAAMLARLRSGGFQAAADTLVRQGQMDFSAYRSRVKRRVAAQLKGWFRSRVRALAAVQRLQWLYHHRLHPLCPGKSPRLRSVAQLVKSGHLSAEAIADPWSTPLTWTRTGLTRSAKHFLVTLHSAGPDARWSTVDDLKAGPFKLVLPKLRRKTCYYGYSSGHSFHSYRSRSPRVFCSRASVSGFSRDAGALPTWAGDQPEPRVRRNFKETLAALPSLRTDGQGRATVKLRLADNITTWVVHGIASDLAGRLGGAVTRMRTFQPFYVDVLLPQRLTRTDEVEVPVVVHNYTGKATTVKLRLQGNRGLAPVRQPGVQLRLVPGPRGPRLLRTATHTTERQRTIIVPARGVATTRFRIRALRVGRGALTVHARAAGLADAVQRTTRIVPEGVERSEGAAGFLSQTIRHRVTLPKGFVPHSQRLTVTLEPSLLAASRSSLDALLRRPHGCMEQSSAVTYPNILVLQHLRRLRSPSKARRRVIARARRLVHEGYQRLLGFEVTGGGFSLYGAGPADVSLSALGLAQLTDLASVRYVDPRLISRTRRHLLRSQTPSGSWKAVGYVDLGGGDPLTRRFVVTAYVAWQLARSGLRTKREKRAVKRALGFLQTHLFLVGNDPYALALAANAAQAAPMGRHKSFAQTLRRLLLAKAHRSQTTHWRPGERQRTVFAGDGRAAATETTALALLALHREKGISLQTAGAIRFLLKARQPTGAWSTTRATVLALMALLRAAPRNPGALRKMSVYLNGRLRGTLLPGTGGTTTHTLDLSTGLSAGTHRLRLVPVGGGNALYRIGLRYHSQTTPTTGRKRPRIQVRYARLKLRPRQWVRVKVRLNNPTGAALIAPMVELGLPPGFTLTEAAIEAIATRAGIQRTERRPGKLLLYWTTMPRGTTTFSLKLQARHALRVRIPRSRFYEYYRPEHPSVTAASVIEVHRRRPRIASVRDLLR